MNTNKSLFLKIFQVLNKNTKVIPLDRMLSFFFILIIVIFSSTCNLQAGPVGSISIDTVIGQMGVDTIAVGLTTFKFRVSVSGSSENVLGFTSGFRIFSPDGATWGTPQGDTISGLQTYFDLLLGINYFSGDGSGADTIAFAGASMINGGWPSGYDTIPFFITIHTDNNDIEKTICIDSSWFPPSNTWLWTGSSGSGYPTWSGEKCYIVGATDDTDGDGIGDFVDNCISVYNPDQEDADLDMIGDSCDLCSDSDNDGYGNPGYPANTCPDDICPNDYNPDQDDSDSDDTGDSCDNCIFVYNPNQDDIDIDGKGDLCDVGEVLFTASQKSGPAPLSVTFTDQSIAFNTITEWFWDFGDSETSTETNPIHIYNDTGTYDVMLIISDNSLYDTLIMNSFIHVMDSSQWTGYNISKTYFADMNYLTTGDLNHDNELDLIYSGWNDGTYVVYGDGSGSFDPPILLGPWSYSKPKLDFINTDSLIDLVVASSNEVNIFISNGDGTFNISSWSINGSSLPMLETGHFNDDSFMDLIVSPNKLFFGDGTGAFPSSTTLPVDVVVSADQSDFNLDGKFDLIAVGGDSAWILINDGDGNFLIETTILLSNSSISVSTGNALADFNRDGNPDFVLTDPLMGIDECEDGWRTVITIGLGNGDGGLSSIDTFSVCGTSYNMVLADVNRDYDLDLIIANGSKKSLEIFYGDGSGTFGNKKIIPLETDYITFVLATGDIDRDGNPDFISGGGLLSGDSIILAINQLPDAPVLADEMAVTGYGTITVTVTNPMGYVLSRNYQTIAGGDAWVVDADIDGILDKQVVDYNLMYGEYIIDFELEPWVDPNSEPIFSAGIRLNGTAYLTIFADLVYDVGLKSEDDKANNKISFYYPHEEVSSVYPPTGYESETTIPGFWWGYLEGFAGAEKYHFQLDNYYDFRSPRYDNDNISQIYYIPDEELGTDTVYYWRVSYYDGVEWSPFSRTYAVYVTGTDCCVGLRGDVTGDNLTLVNDLVFLVNYVFKSGSAPSCEKEGDANGDGNILVNDLVSLVNYIFKGGLAPVGCW